MKSDESFSPPLFTILDLFVTTLRHWCYVFMTVRNALEIYFANDARGIGEFYEELLTAG